MKALLLAEKPSQERAIRQTYNMHKHEIPYELDTIAFAGHIDYMKQPKEYEEWSGPWSLDYLPIFPDESKTGWQFGISPDKKKIYTNVKNALNKDYDFIINAGDPDQEGEVLINRILVMLHNKKPVKRFWLQSLTDEDILNKLKNLDDDNEEFYRNLFTAGQLRAEYDYLIGMNITTAATVAFHTKTIVGRVMTPSLNIMAIREREIQNFKPSFSYNVIEDYDGFTGTLLDEEGRVRVFTDKTDAERTSAQMTGTAKVMSIEQKDESRKAPPLYILSSLQKDAGKCGIGVAKSTEIVQKLYEEGYISYPRTDCGYMSSSAVGNASGILNGIKGLFNTTDIINSITAGDINRVSKDKMYVNDAAVAQGNHTAIIPTGKKCDISLLTPDEQSILRLVYMRFIAIFLPPEIKTRTTVLTNDDDNIFKASGAVIKSPGWTILYGKKTNPDDEIINVKCRKGDMIPGIPGIKEKEAQKPKHYTDAEFPTVMENPAKFLVNGSNKDTIKQSKGIGTQATRAEIINKLARAGYITLTPVGKKQSSTVNEIAVTQAGMALIDMLAGKTIINVDMTAEMEDRLKMVRLGQLSREEFTKMMKEQVLCMIEEMKNTADMMKNTPQYQNMQQNTNNVKETLGTCPCCGKPVYYSTKKNSGYCSDFNNCSFYLPSEFIGAKITKTDMKKLISGEQIKKTLKKGDHTWEQLLQIGDDAYNGRTQKKICFVKTEASPLNLQCPCCGKPLKETAKYFLCTDYKQGCDFLAAKNMCGASITTDDMQKLLHGERVTKTMTSNGNKWVQQIELGNDTYNGETHKRICFVKQENNAGSNMVTDMSCPNCGKPVKETSKYFLCTDYKNGCDFIVGKNYYGAEFSADDVRQMIDGDRLTKDFTWKSGKTSTNQCGIEDGQFKVFFD